jgi:hypothetical protein
MTQIPPDHELVDLPKEALQKLKWKLTLERTEAANANRFNRHQRIGEAILKVTQILEQL